MYLGIDLGTSCVKVLLLNDDDQLIAQASAPLVVSRPKDLWAEQSPDDWWQATNSAMASLQKNHAAQLTAVQAIGLSGQMHGATLLDKSDQVIRPAILWNDGRSFAECTDIEQRVPSSRDITGNIAMPGFTAPKLAWINKHYPSEFNKINKVLLPKDYLRLRMTGEYASDLSDSAGTLWLDVANRQWSKQMLAATELSIEHMPKLFEGTEITGVLTADIAQDWGMQQVPVAAGGGDNAAGAAGIGVIQPNQAFLSLGTSGVYFVANQSYQPNPNSAVHTFCHCIPDTWHQMSVILSAASCLQWVTQLTGFANEQVLLNEVEQQDFSQPCPVLFLPYLSGERTPHNNPNAKGVFFGLSHQTSAAVLGRAVLEGVAFAFADGQQALVAAGAKITQVSVIGGGARSALWGKILASVLNQPLIYRRGAEVGPAYGAAKLAKIAVTNTTAEQVCQPGEINSIIEPVNAQHDFYVEQHHKYQTLYQQIKQCF